MAIMSRLVEIAFGLVLLCRFAGMAAVFGMICHIVHVLGGLDKIFADRCWITKASFPEWGYDGLSGSISNGSTIFNLEMPEIIPNFTGPGINIANTDLAVDVSKYNQPFLATSTEAKLANNEIEDHKMLFHMPSSVACSDRMAGCTDDLDEFRRVSCQFDCYEDAPFECIRLLDHLLDSAEEFSAEDNGTLNCSTFNGTADVTFFHEETILTVEATTCPCIDCPSWANTIDLFGLSVLCGRCAWQGREYSRPDFRNATEPYVEATRGQVGKVSFLFGGLAWVVSKLLFWSKDAMTLFTMRDPLLLRKLYNEGSHNPKDESTDPILFVSIMHTLFGMIFPAICLSSIHSMQVMESSPEMIVGLNAASSDTFYYEASHATVWYVLTGGFCLCCLSPWAVFTQMATFEENGGTRPSRVDRVAMGVAANSPPFCCLMIIAIVWLVSMSSYGHEVELVLEFIIPTFQVSFPSWNFSQTLTSLQIIEVVLSGLEALSFILKELKKCAKCARRVKA